MAGQTDDTDIMAEVLTWDMVWFGVQNLIGTAVTSAVTSDRSAASSSCDPTSELCPDARLARHLEHLLFPLKVAIGAAMVVATGGQVVEIPGMPQRQRIGMVH